MNPSIAWLLCYAFIFYLFRRDFKRTHGVSNAIWIPLTWAFIAGSRSVSAWLNLGAPEGVSVAQAYQQGNPLDRNVMLVLYICGAFVLARRRLIWSEIVRTNLLIVFFFIYCLISILWADYPLVAFKRLIRFAVLITMILVVLSEDSPVDAFLALMRRCSYVLVSLSFLFVKYIPELGRYYNPHTWQVAYSGVGGNKNELGLLCVISALIFIWELLQRWNDKNKFFTSIDTWTYLFLLGITFYFLKLADSATSLMCTIIIAAILIGTNIPFFKKKPELMGTIVITVVVVLVLLQITFDIKGAIIQALGRPPGLKRSDLWEKLFSMASNPLLGAGYESFWTLDRLSFLRASNFTATQAHNGYIDTYLNLGFIGVFFFITLLLSGYRRIIREMTVSIEFNRLKLAFIVIFALYNYTEAVFPRPGLFFFFLFLIIMEIPQTVAQQVFVQNIDENVT